MQVDRKIRELETQIRDIEDRLIALNEAEMEAELAHKDTSDTDKEITYLNLKKTLLKNQLAALKSEQSVEAGREILREIQDASKQGVSGKSGKNR